MHWKHFNIIRLNLFRVVSKAIISSTRISIVWNCFVHGYPQRPPHHWCFFNKLLRTDAYFRYQPGAGPLSCGDTWETAAISTPKVSCFRVESCFFLCRTLGDLFLRDSIGISIFLLTVRKPAAVILNTRRLSSRNRRALSYERGLFFFIIPRAKCF